VALAGGPVEFEPPEQNDCRTVFALAARVQRDRRLVLQGVY